LQREQYANAKWQQQEFFSPTACRAFGDRTNEIMSGAWLYTAPRIDIIVI